MPKLPKQGFSEERKRSEVGKVMECWNDQQRFPTFAPMFDALLKANDNMSARDFSIQLSRMSGRAYGHAAIQCLRDGTGQPTYQFAKDVIETNILNLDPQRIQPLNGMPMGDQRIAFFTKAELIEVTPETMQAFNADVMASVKRHIDRGNRPHWSDIIRKLVEFRTQGERDSVVDIQRRLQAGSDAELFPTKDMLPNILGKNACASKDQRDALYREVGLSRDDAAYLNDMLAKKNISEEILPGNPTRFSTQLDDILSRLVGFASLQDLQRASVDLVTNRPRILGSQLSLLRQGKGPNATRAKLRAMLDVLEPWAGEHRPLQAQELDTLAANAGFTRTQLAFSPRDLITKADEATTDIHALLSDIRYTREVGLTLDQAADRGRMTALGVSLSADQINSWETAIKTCPTREQVSELLGRYNGAMVERYIRVKNLEEPGHVTTPADAEAAGVTLRADEIAKVGRISDACRDAWEAAQKSDKKAMLRNDISWRKRVTPEVPVVQNGFSISS